MTEDRFDHLAPCPRSPNCVCSDAPDASHRIEPFRLTGDAAAGWARIRKTLERQPRTRLISATDRYLHAEVRSRIFRFVDDLELLLSPDDGTVAVRSASRLGHSDFGVNRKRVERLRRLLAGQGAISG